MFKIVAIVLFGMLAGCAHGKKSGLAKSPAPVASEKNDSKLEAAAEKALEKTEEDQRMAPTIQKDLNAIFFKQKEERPGGLDAFSPERIQQLEVALTASERPSLQYFRENREYFEQLQDEGGGFRIIANAKRLVAYRWTKAGRRKLFAMDSARVKEMIAHPCFSAVEDCGESSSDGEENTSLLDEWSKKYPEKEYQAAREKILTDYIHVLEKYRKRIARRLPKKRGRASAELVDSHIRGVQSLLKD